MNVVLETAAPPGGRIMMFAVRFSAEPLPCSKISVAVVPLATVQSLTVQAKAGQVPERVSVVDSVRRRVPGVLASAMS